MSEEKETNDKKEGAIIEPTAATEQPPVPSYSKSSKIADTVPKRISPARMRILGAAFLIMVSGAAGFGGGWLGNHKNETQTIEKQQVVLKGQGQLISSIAKQVGPSVVSVDVTSTTQPSSYFGYQGSTEQQSAGTGIILSKDGMIITNRHVVPAGSTQVGVTLSDGTKYDNVQVIGRTSDSDPLDIAFLKIKDTKGKTLTPATIGDSSKVGVGDSVVAIGNALGQFQNSVTSGIISGFGRSIQAGDQENTSGTTENLQNLFQTDAAINPGNSGGPLVNLNGEVVGINTATASNGAQNIGFAIPINDVKGVIASVTATGKLERPYIGVVFVSITADLAQQYSLGATQGAYIPPSVITGQDSVIKGGPADKAGIKEGDIITKIDDQALDANNTLTSTLGKYKVGDQVKVTILRGGKTQTIAVTLGTAPSDATQNN